jgi:hypothetical protein
MDEIFNLIDKVGFPIAAAIASGYLVFLTLKFILAGVTSSIQSIKGIIVALDNRVRTMNHDLVRIDVEVSNAMGLKPDTTRLARADGKDDSRKD